MASFKPQVKRMLEILYRDLPTLKLIQNYVEGKQAAPYIPDEATAEYKLLVKRCITNVTTLLEGTPAQACYVDGFRPGRSIDGGALQETPEWKHWQRSKLDSRQVPITRGAIRFGHSFTLTEKHPKRGVVTRGLSPLRTTALFEDPANDLDPIAAIYVKSWPDEDVDDDEGIAIAWDETNKYEVKFTGGAATIAVGKGEPHGLDECPVTRFAMSVDLEGNTTGAIYPFIPIQDRINQTVFDLLLAQTFGSTNVRTATGMKIPFKRDPITGEEVLDEYGNPVPVNLRANASRLLVAEDPDTKFGTLPATPLDGFIAAVDLAFRHISAISQTPPHHLLGQIANLSAEALDAAAQSGERKAAEIRVMFGEAWERVFRLAAALEGVTEAQDDYAGEVLWRDVDGRSLSRAADGLGKLRSELQVPAKGLWPMVPGVTQNQLRSWEDLAEEDPESMLANTLSRATSPAFSDADGQ